MKRKPIDIVADILNVLNGYRRGKAFNINSLKEKSNIHWKTTQDYLNLIYFIQKFAPEIEINKQKKEFFICTHSKYFSNFNLENQLIIYLFLEKAFDSKNRIDLNSIIDFRNSYNVNCIAYSKFNSMPKSQIKSDQRKKIISQLKKSEYIRVLNSKQKITAVYLSLKGKFKAQGLLSQINEEMAKFIENPHKIEFYNKNENIIRPFMHKKMYKLRYNSNQLSDIKFLNEEFDEMFDKIIYLNDHNESKNLKNKEINETASATLVA
ncbi:MAG: hypothetical protein K9W44_13410 [Candidatus Lokiarchaeota archaeon]|nr:hypothetical protein [Candidatus Harpocratesius repetitus]